MYLHCVLKIDGVVWFGPRGSGVSLHVLRVSGGKGVGLQGLRGSRGRPTGSQGVGLLVLKGLRGGPTRVLGGQG